MQLNPVLFFNGNAEEVLEHYRSALGGEIQITRFAGTPAADGLPAEWQNNVLYGALCAPCGLISIMDAPPGRGGEAGGRFSLSIESDSETQAAQIFGKLADGGQIMMPFAKTFWAEKFGMVTDKYGIKWMVSYGTLALQRA